ncbi:helix-turn-helix transcriptional regulator [Shewanella fodinae]|uniref:helix-turn-helix transcriptional regulator n=1 Tax=Shewanella fodinae TaxID=552357 RepID=UPI001678914A|nr:hypothetical protein [Shewanella fodinae]MCL2905171.1 hypothetical protein [Shewanella fodinae]GGY88028.1 hypothetical protein GCM10007169_01530 [Shewanella fodinae]
MAGVNQDQLPLNEPMFLNTKQVLARYGINSAATLWNWRQTLGFPKPIHNGRHYDRRQLDEWDQKQRAA